MPAPVTRPAVTPPGIQREFRGAWIATVKNIDWPSKPGLSSDEQKAELLAILNRAVELNLNALIFQVRAGCDALYASPIEPWSEYLTGKMGQAPSPFYDPLAFLIEQSHARGIEIHAWFNPYRARRDFQTTNTPFVAANHITKTNPELVQAYGPDQLLDPAEPQVQARAKAVMLDVVHRYDVDGIHIDDYFYPFPLSNGHGGEIPFQDERTWKAYVAKGGKLTRSDWRRQNVDQFIEDLYASIKREKRWVKFGISPFGIWRPGSPPGTIGRDAYAELYADARKWMLEGSADYFAPQLYWTNGTPGHSYPDLLTWWTQQNAKARHLWPGSATYQATDKAKANPRWLPDEIVNQVGLARRQMGVTGEIQYNMSALMKDTNGPALLLRHRVYSEPALVPASPWLDNTPPGKPTLANRGGTDGKTRELVWEPTGSEKVWLWVVQTETDGVWKTEILPASQTTRSLPQAGPSPQPSHIAVTAIDRSGNASPPAVLFLDRTGN